MNLDKPYTTADIDMTYESGGAYGQSRNCWKLQMRGTKWMMWTHFGMPKSKKPNRDVKETFVAQCNEDRKALKQLTEKQ